MALCNDLTLGLSGIRRTIDSVRTVSSALIAGAGGSSSRETSLPSAQDSQESLRRLVQIAQAVHDPVDPPVDGDCRAGPVRPGEPLAALRLGASARVRMVSGVSRRGSDSTQIPDRTSRTDAVPNGRIKVLSQPFTESNGNPGKS